MVFVCVIETSVVTTLNARARSSARPRNSRRGLPLALFHRVFERGDQGGVLSQDRSERFLLDLDERRLGRGAHGRRAGIAGQEAYLSERGAGLQDRQLVALAPRAEDRDGDA